MISDKVNLADIVHTSTVDFEGKVSMVIFLEGCNFNCGYCSNYKYVDSASGKQVDIEIVKQEINLSKDFIDAVIISGGEPLLQYEAVKDIMKHVKDLCLLTGLQTNGYNYYGLYELLEGRLLDAVFLDIKAPLIDRLYFDTCGMNASDEVLKSILFCSKAYREKKLAFFEARTTAFKGLTIEDVEQISNSIPICSQYVLQQGRIELARPSELLPDENYTVGELRELATGSKHVTKIRSRFGTELIKKPLMVV